jgi:nucleotide-binding universal stress UspA family protein
MAPGLLSYLAPNGRDFPSKRWEVVMNITNILFPTDFSERSVGALDYASQLAERFGAVLHIVHVDDLSEMRAMSAAEGFMVASSLAIADLGELQDRLEAIKPTVPGVRCKYHLVQGVPSAEIRALAQSNDVDLIVMSSHGRTGLSRLLMGSVAENVLRYSKCPVLILHPSRDVKSSETHDAALTQA